MPVITLSNRAYPVDKNQNLLDSLLAKGEKIPFSCRSGICHACLMKADTGHLSERSQAGLSSEKVHEGYFLACQCLPENDMTVSLPGRSHTQAIITGKQFLCPTVVALTLAPRHPMNYFPGQHVCIDTGLRLKKECYLASVPSMDQTMVIQVQRKVADPFSTWAHDFAETGQKISISSPRGINLCGSLLDIPDQILIAQEVALAPILAYVREALNNTGSSSQLRIHLIHEASNSNDHFGIERLEALSQMDQFSYALTTGRQDYGQWLDSALPEASSIRVICAGEASFCKPIEESCSQHPGINYTALNSEFS
ncbi:MULTISPECIES: 2Fe-2S iron-sulfur cluster-binding protein [unclassified Endozoicomonas]|uniref:2Fe-2S iron-sulfur cluster-binding protein n=1 Tax=unclassified Endozoicomonas TaxID=2644528 RepID=UPI003BB61644